MGERGAGLTATAAPGATVAARLRRLVLDWAPLVPFLVVAGGLLVGSGLWLIRTSLEGTDGGWSLQAWRDILAPGLNRTAILRSLRLSVTVAVLAALVGTPLAWFVGHLAGRGRTLSMALMNVAANFGGAPLAIAFVSTIGTLGFVRLLLDDWFGVGLPVDLLSFRGYVLVFLYFVVPLYVLLVLPAMGSLRAELWEAAQTSSATRWQFWRHVGVPVLGPFVAAGTTLAFAWSIGQYSVIAALTGSSSNEQLITTRIASFLGSATGGSNRFQRAAAMSVLLMIIAGGSLLLYRLLVRRSLAHLRDTP